mmetsp:Transcript_18855/g.48404  ORF Transcript_18855/g.48404 Transcript_18855/m.48404 type:complete len:487 (+) Transcript_18855:337-1797(+)
MGMFASVVAGVEWREGRVAGRKARRLLSLETRRPAELNLRCVMALKSLKVHEQRLKVHACIRAPLIFPILAVSLVIILLLAAVILWARFAQLHHRHHGHRFETRRQRLEGLPLRQKHEEAVQGVQQRWMLCRLEDVQPQEGEDRGFQQPDDPVQLHEHLDVPVHLPKRVYQRRCMRVFLGQKAEREQRPGRVRPRLVEREEQLPACGGVLGALQHVAQLLRLGGGEQDEVERLHHGRGVFQVGLVRQARRELEEALIGAEQHAEAAQHHRPAALQQLRALRRLEGGDQLGDVLLEVRVAAGGKGGLHGEALQHDAVAWVDHHAQQRRQQRIGLVQHLLLPDVEQEVDVAQRQQAGRLLLRAQPLADELQHLVHGDLLPALAVLQLEDVVDDGARHPLDRLVRPADALEQGVQDAVKVRQQLQPRRAGIVGALQQGHLRAGELDEDVEPPQCGEADVLLGVLCPPHQHVLHQRPKVDVAPALLLDVA